MILPEETVEAVLNRWRKMVAETYPEDARRFIISTPDRFANPVGYTLDRALPEILSAVLSDEPTPLLDDAVREFIRVRAVQSFAPGAAVGFVVLLKDALREHNPAHPLPNELLETLNRRIDRLLLAMFDEYTACRERISQVRVNETNRRMFLLMRKFGLEAERASDDPEVVPAAEGCCNGARR